MPRATTSPTLLIFPTKLGWMAVIHADRILRRLVFGYPNADATHAAADAVLNRKVRPDPWERRLIERLEAYAWGEPEDFRDLQVEFCQTGTFTRRVYDACRKIPYGRVRSYGELAAAAGSPRAARAVGNGMARNQVPLVVPCHRVIGGAGSLGGYSAPGGPAVKLRLLQLEGCRCPSLFRRCRELT